MREGVGFVGGGRFDATSLWKDKHGNEQEEFFDRICPETNETTPVGKRVKSATSRHEETKPSVRLLTGCFNNKSLYRVLSLPILAKNA